MTGTGAPQLEQNIARCRLVLSVAAIAAMYVDPAEPLLSRWVPLASGLFVMDYRLILVLAAHLSYSLLVWVSLRPEMPQVRAGVVTVWLDVLFGAAIGILTEGPTSPSYPFFAFAVVAAGLRAGQFQAALVTVASLGLYESFILLSARGGADVYLMRPVYLAITGYLVGSLGQQRRELQEQMRQLDVTQQRQRIARDLHDNFTQALAGINLRLEGCRRQLCSDPHAPVLGELTELQESVKREFDELRSYTRSLAGLDATLTPGSAMAPTRLSLRADVVGSVDLIDHLLQIVREGIANVRRHASAKTAKIEIVSESSVVRILVEDDGVGLPVDAVPWSIASRVKEIGGNLQIVAPPDRGAQLLITVPLA